MQCCPALLHCANSMLWGLQVARLLLYWVLGIALPPGLLVAAFFLPNSRCGVCGCLSLPSLLPLCHLPASTCPICSLHALRSLLQ